MSIWSFAKHKQKSVSRRLALLLLAVLPWCASPVLALDCSVKIDVPPRPYLNKETDYSTWVVKIMKHKQRKREREEHARQCPDLYVATPNLSDDPTVIEQPETIKDALARTQKLPNFDYSKNASWYDRTTSRTFALPALPGSDMSEVGLLSSLVTLDENAPLPELAGFGQLFPGYLINGEEASAEGLESLGMLVFNQEGDLQDAFGIAQGGGQLAQVITNGNVTLLMGPDGNVYRVQGDIFYENCLSSCVLYGR